MEFLIRYYILENKIITRISIKQGVIVCMGYEVESNFIQEEYLEETIYLQNNDDLCSFTEIIDLSNINSYQEIESPNSRNTSKISVEIFPNPTKNSITVSINNGDISNESKFIAEIRNIYGSKVNSYIIDTKRNINLSDFSSGIYMIHILNEEGNAVFARKVIKL